MPSALPDLAVLTAALTGLSPSGAGGTPPAISAPDLTPVLAPVIIPLLPTLGMLPVQVPLAAPATPSITPTADGGVVVHVPIDVCVGVLTPANCAPTNDSVPTNGSVPTNASVPAADASAGVADSCAPVADSGSSTARPAASARSASGSGGLPVTGLSLIALLLAGGATLSWGVVARLVASRKLARTAAS